MARFEAADKRLFANMWICQKCNAKNRSTEGKKPNHCRKCKGRRLRLKNKAKKTTSSA